MYINYIKDYLKAITVEYLLFFSIIIFIVFTPNNSFFSFDNKRIFEVCIIFVNLIILVNKSIRNNLIQAFCLFSLKTRMLLSLLLILAIASSAYALLIRSAFLETSVLSGLFLISMTVFCLCLKNKVLFSRVFITAVIFSVIIYQVNFFALYLYAIIHKITIQGFSLFTGFSNVRTFNQYQVWLFFLISYPVLIFKEMDFRISNALKIMSAGWACLLFYSASRGAVIAVFSGLVISGFVFKRQAIDFIKLNLLFLCYGAISAWLLFKLLPLVLNSEITSNWRSLEQLVMDSPRLYLWKRALSHIYDHPWLGVGPMHYAYYPNPMMTEFAFGSPHNSILQWASEMGLLSVTILLSLITQGLRLWIKQFKEILHKNAIVAEESSLWIVLFATVCAGFIYSLADGLVSPTEQILMAVILGWMLGLYFQFNKKTEPKNNLLVLVFAGILLLTLAYTVLPGLIPRLAGNEDFSTREHSKLKYPRFWLQGHIPE